uniref:Muscle-specific beta 1 integrin binding protein 2 n=1 Tax=Cyprinus carpio TaxID=7962 RepID=A0A8C1TCU3_CYPCA
MKHIIGIGGVTNGGKTTLTNRLIKALPNCCVVHQDDFFKVSSTKCNIYIFCIFSISSYFGCFTGHCYFSRRI